MNRSEKTKMETDAQKDPITVTENAARRISELALKQGNAELKLRLSVKGGGCSGFQYDFSLVEAPEDGDILVTKNGAKVVVDPMSLLYLMGSELDFVEDIIGSSFRLQNPNVEAACGCGTSFSLSA